jgi:cytochrome oxidase Cu insertion factor (SCO1/SenC/PrrC family)
VASPRAKLVGIMALFALPIVASTLAYHFFRPERATNHGELIAPPPAFPDAVMRRADGGAFRFTELKGGWVLVASDAGACPETCIAKLTLMRQVRLALGREAGRVTRVFVSDDSRPVAAETAAPFEGTRFVSPPLGLALPPVPLNDRAHFYLADPNGNVMMRWPAGIEAKKVLQDLKRLLKASQIG